MKKTMNDNSGKPARKPKAATRKSRQVFKTYKLYIGGQFPRTESGRHYGVGPSDRDRPVANVCQASRKDVRNAVSAARQAQAGWNARSAYNKSQILYRIAELLNGRFEQFKSELQLQGLRAGEAEAEVQKAIDRVIYFCGWCDKYQQVFSTVNPVATSHFNFSMLEPMGVVGLVAHEAQPLLGLVSLLMPIIAGGNTCIALASESRPLSAITFSEVLNSADLPAGVVNIVTGRLEELIGPLARHQDINALAFNRQNAEGFAVVQEVAADSLKRVRRYDLDWTKDESASPSLISDFSETKTTWHPIERITSAGSGY